MIDLYQRDFKQEPNGSVFVESRVQTLMDKAMDMRSFISKEMGEGFIISVKPGHFVDYGAKSSTTCFKVTMNRERGEAMEYWETEYFDLLAKRPKEMDIALNRFRKGFEDANIKPLVDINVLG